ncbi:squalene/phytoene synthase family protein, partial [Enterococcus faecium]|uniref:squalene/phytoene synthase family protein n=1 Tax=Enterococcus faecium TaxID=1352 RepID=UPI003F43CB1D
EDARAGRCYLPQSWLAQAGCDEASVRAAGAMPPELRPVLDRLAAEAERRYGLAASGIAALPWSCRPAMHGARLLYRAIGRRAVRVDP